MAWDNCTLRRGWLGVSNHPERSGTNPMLSGTKDGIIDRMVTSRVPRVGPIGTAAGRSAKPPG